MCHQIEVDPRRRVQALKFGLPFQRPTQASVPARALQPIVEVAPSQRARILFEAVQDRRFSTIACILHGVLGLATFAAAIAPGIGGGPQGTRHPLTPSLGIAAFVAIAMLGGTLSLSSSRSRAAKLVAALEDSEAPPGVTLPTVRGTFWTRDGGLPARRTVIGPGGAELEKTSGGLELGKTSGVCAMSFINPGGALAVYGDRSVTSAQLVGVLEARGCDKFSLVFVARRDHDPAIDAQLGEMAAYLGPAVAYVPATVTIDPPSRREDVVEVRSVTDDAIEIDGKRVAFPIPPGTSFDHRSGRLSKVRYAFRPTDTIERMVRVVVGVRDAVGYPLGSATAIDIGMPPRPPKYADLDLDRFHGIGLGSTGGNGKAPSLRQGALQVSGHLPPEVIQRIVRQHFGRLRICYENGLRTDPKLAGRVNVQFVIDRSGFVTTAQDGGSSLPDAAGVGCVVRAFGYMTV